MNSFNISTRRVGARRAVGMDGPAMLITLCLCAIVFAGFYALGRKEATPAISREVAPLRLPITATATVVPPHLSDAPALALTAVVVVAPPPPAAEQSQSPPAARVSTPVLTPAAAPPVPTPVVPTTPAPVVPQRASAPTPSHGGGSSSGGSSHHEGGGTSFDTSG